MSKLSNPSAPRHSSSLDYLRTLFLRDEQSFRLVT